MNNEELINKNNQAQQKIESGINQFRDAGAGGLNLMDLAMNPGKAVERFSGPLSELLEGIEGMRQVNNELVKRVTAGG